MSAGYKKRPSFLYVQDYDNGFSVCCWIEKLARCSDCRYLHIINTNDIYIIYNVTHKLQMKCISFII